MAGGGRRAAVLSEPLRGPGSLGGVTEGNRLAGKRRRRVEIGVGDGVGSRTVVSIFFCSANRQHHSLTPAASAMAVVAMFGFLLALFLPFLYLILFIQLTFLFFFALRFRA